MDATILHEPGVAMCGLINYRLRGCRVPLSRGAYSRNTTPSSPKPPVSHQGKTRFFHESSFLKCFKDATSSREAHVCRSRAKCASCRQTWGSSIRWTLPEMSLPAQAELNTSHLCMLNWRLYKNKASPLFLQISSHRASVLLSATDRICTRNIVFSRWPGAHATVVDGP